MIAAGSAFKSTSGSIARATIDTPSELTSGSVYPSCGLLLSDLPFAFAW